MNRSRWMIFLCCVGHFNIDFMFGIWPLYKTMVGMDLALAGLIAGVSSFFGEMLQLFFGALSDKGYRFLVMSLGIFLANCFVFLPWFPLTAALFFIYFPLSMGSSSFHPPAAGIMGQVAPSQRNLYVSIFWACGSLGLALSQLVFYEVYTYFEGQFFVCGGLALFLIPLALFFHFSQKKTIGIPATKFTKKDLYALFQNRSTRYLWLSQVCFASVFWGTLFLLPDFFVEVGYPRWLSAGSGHFVYVVGGTFSSVVAGVLADRFNPKAIILASICAGALCYYTLVFSGLMLSYKVLMVIFSIGALVGLTQPLAIAMGNTLMPHSPALVSAFLMGFVWFASEFIGIGGAGCISGLFSTWKVLSTMSILGTLFVVGFFFMLLVPNKKSSC